jgi:hypothetical protein
VSATGDGKLHSSDSVSSLSAVGAGGTERQNDDGVQIPRDSSIDTIGDTSVQSNMAVIAHISPDQCGLPLMLFTQVGLQCVSRKSFVNKLWVFFLENF